MPPRNRARLAVQGDIVFGLASAAPPQPFVGEIGDPAGDSARGITGPLKRSAGAGGSEPLRMTVNGRPVAMRTDRAIDLGPTDLVALPTGSLPSLCVGGQQCLAHAGPFQVSPSGSLKSLSLMQPVAYGDDHNPTGGGSDDAGGDTSGGGAGSARADFSDPSALHRMLSRTSSARLADLVPPEHAFLVGDPVDVATGAVVTEFVDFERTVPPIRFRRSYTSLRSDVDGPLGFGWTHNFDQCLWLEAGRVVVRDAGREIEFDCLDLPDAVARAGDELFDPTGRLRLRCHGRNHWELLADDHIRHFTPLRGTDSADRDRGFARLTKVIRPHQPLTELEYDDYARLAAVRIDGRSMFTLRYDTQERIQSLGDGTTRFEYSENGDLVRATDALGYARTYEYAGHLLVRETNRRGGAFYYGYDGHGARAKCIRTWGTRGRLHRVLSYEPRATVVTDSLGHRTTYAVNAARLVTSVGDPLSNHTGYSYDDALRLVRIAYADGTTTTDTYDDNGHWVKRRDRDGALWRMRHDAAGRLVEGFDPTGGQWRFAYDFEGRLTRVDDPLGHVTRLEYLNRQLERITDPLGRVTQLRLGPDDEVLHVAAPNAEPVSFEYDARGRLVCARPEASPETRWSYDALGRVLSIRRGAEYVRFERDAEGSLVLAERPSGAWKMRRDVLGTLEGLSDGERELSYDFDTEGRMVRAKVRGKSRIEVRRDERGLVSAYVIDGVLDGIVQRELGSENISRIGSGDDLVTIKRDAAGRIVEFGDHGGTRRFAYREDGLLTQFSSPQRACTVERNERGVVTRQLQGETVLASPHVDHRGMRYGLELGDDVSISYLWSVDGQLDRVAVAAQQAFDIDVEQSDGAVGTAASSDTAATRDAPADGPTDALHRPIARDGGEALIWDEDHLICDGTRLHVADPRSGRRLATVDGKELLETPESPFGVRRMLRAEEQAYADSFPNSVATPAFESHVPTPLGLLQQTLACRVWDPVIRPLSGALPWQPDLWHPDDGDVAPERTRLEPAALMRLLSPFPRPLLR